MTNNFLEYALRYAKLGWKVFPCRPRQKVPATLHGVRDATSNTAIIKGWWSDNPDANIAVACGEPSGIHVVDVDVDEEKGIDGQKALEKLKKQGHSFNATVMQLTPRGGAHFFYQTEYPPRNKNSLFPGIDIRSTGFYVVLTPSVHPNGKRYEWPEGFSPWEHKYAHFPECLRPPGKANASDYGLQGLDSLPDTDVLRRASAYLETCDAAIQGMGGHDKLLWAAVAMVHGFLLTDDQAYRLLANEYNPRCVPPWDLSVPKDAKDFKRKVSEARKLKPQYEPGWLLRETADNIFTPEDIQRLIRNSTRTGKLVPTSTAEARKELAGIVKKETEELQFLCRPVGLLGDICSWINSTARKPQPWLTLGCALTFCGTLFGSKVKGDDELRTNIYCMGVAPSSAGKNHAPRQIRRLCLEAGCLDLLGGDDFASDTGIEARLEVSPATLFLCDEIGHLLAAIKSGKNPYTAKVVSLLMKLYSLSDSVYTGREYKDTDKRRVLVEPCCCLYGYSHPSRFFDGLSPEELQDGWLSRCLVFYTEDDPSKCRSDRVKNSSVPADLAQRVNAWFARQMTHEAGEGNLTGIVRAHATGSVSIPPAPLTVPVTQEAEEVFARFDNEVVTYGVKNPELATLWKKGEENARKIALIVAAGDSFEEPIITSAIADYGCRLAKFLLQDFSTKASRITGSAIGKKKQRVLAVIDRAGARGCTKGRLTQRTPWTLKRERDALLQDLIDSGEAVVGQGDRTLRLWTKEKYQEYLSQKAPS